MVVRSRYITIEGLKPGYIVRIINLENGEIIFEKRATSSELKIDAVKDIGLSKPPIKVMIQVIRT